MANVNNMAHNIVDFLPCILSHQPNGELSWTDTFHLSNLKPKSYAPSYLNLNQNYPVDCAMWCNNFMLELATELRMKWVIVHKIEHQLTNGG